MPIRVLIADDYMPFRLMLRYLLETQDDLEVVGEAPDGAVAVALAEELQPDVVMLDLAMPVMDGWEAIPHLHEVAPDARIIVLSGFPEDKMRHSELRSMTAAYLEKGEPEEAITGAIRRAAATAGSARDR